MLIRIQKRLWGKMYLTLTRSNQDKRANFNLPSKRRSWGIGVKILPDVKLSRMRLNSYKEGLSLNRATFRILVTVRCNHIGTTRFKSAKEINLSKGLEPILVESQGKLLQVIPSVIIGLPSSKSKNHSNTNLIAKTSCSSYMLTTRTMNLLISHMNIKWCLRNRSNIVVCKRLYTLMMRIWQNQIREFGNS